MSYNWRPRTNRAASTTGSHTTVSPRRPPTEPAAPAAPPEAEHAAPPSAASEDVPVAEMVEEFIAAAQDGRAGNRNGHSYRPSSLRDLRGSLRNHFARDLGQMRLRDVRRQDLQALVDRLAAEGLSESRIRSIVSAIRALYGYAIERRRVELSPAAGLTIPRIGQVIPPDAETVSSAADADVAAADDGASAGERRRPWHWSEAAGARWEDPPRDDAALPQEGLPQDDPPHDDPPQDDPPQDDLPRDDPSRDDRPWDDRLWEERPWEDDRHDPSHTTTEARPRRNRSRDDYRPVTLVPERILSLVLKIVVVLFILFALVTILESV